MEVEDIKRIIKAWAADLPFPVQIHLFGSFLKGKPNPSDIDIALKFLDTFHNGEQRTPESLWFEFHEQWEKDLSQMFGMKVDLELNEPSAKNLQKYLKESSLLVYTSNLPHRLGQKRGI